MGFLNSGGEGAQSFADNFLKTYLGLQSNDRAKEELAIMNQLRQAQMTEMQAQIAERQRKAMREKGLMQAIQGATQAPIPQDMATQQALQTPGSTDTKVLPGFNPQGGAIPEPQGFMPQMPNPLNPQQPNVPIMMQPTPQRTSTGLNQVGQQQVQGLMQGGFDLSKALPGIMQNLPPEQLPQFLAAMKPPRALGLKVETEEQYDPKTHVTFGREYIFDQETGTKQYTSGWKPIKGRESTNRSAQNPVEEDVEVMAQMLAEGKINTTDISKRGGNQQMAAILRRAKEINPSLDPRANMADTSAYSSAINFQQKQLGSMGSFVKNMDMQVSRVEQLAKDLKTFDARILNLPLRAWRGKIAGSKEQAKYDMYITELENEIGKLASGSSASISELSVGAQEKWAKIHDKNLSVKDMISLLKETREAGKLRMKSVEEQLKETRGQMRSRGAENSSTPTQKVWKYNGKTWE